MVAALVALRVYDIDLHAMTQTSRENQAVRYLRSVVTIQDVLRP